MLTGKHVVLRPFRRDDVIAAYEFGNDVELRLLGDQSPPVPQTLEYQLARFDKRQSDDSSPKARFAIEVEGAYIGNCGLYDFSEANQTCQMSIEIINKSYWGKGYGRETVNLLLDYAFRLRNMRKMTLVTSSHNERAIRSYRAVGFKEEGRFLRQQWNNGRYVDWIFMGIFRTDWEAALTVTSTSSVTTELVEVTDLIAHNQERWDALVSADVAYSRPLLDLDEEAARKWVLNEGWVPPEFLEQIAGKDVLCLASGGGQQTAVFGILGANVSVLDFSGNQLAGDRQAAAHYGYPLNAVQGVMTDLSAFADNSFDIIWHPYSINFIPDPQLVFTEVARVLRPNGLYRLTFSNPFRAGIDDESWCGNGYAINHPYVDGTELWADDSTWMVEGKDGSKQPIAGPKEFNHTLGAVVNGIVGRGFKLLHLWEDTGNTSPDLDAKPGSWEHFIAIAPPYMGVWARKSGA